MSIVFKPKIPERYVAPKHSRNKSPTKGYLTNYEIKRLIHLRSLLVPYHEVAAMMGRSYTVWQRAVTEYELTETIASRRNDLIEGEYL